jgi:hypothetical protein
VKVDVLIVDAFIASLKFTMTLLETFIPVAEFNGETLVTDGAVISGAAPVANVELNAVSPLFAMSFAPLVTLTV